MTRIRSSISKNKTPIQQQGFYLIVILIVAIICIIVSFIYQNANKNYNNIKQNKKEYLVYTKYKKENSDYIKEIPYVNLKNDVFKTVNEDIYLFCEEYKNKEKAIITYEYSISGVILSLVVKVVDKDSNYAPEPRFRTYNINLKTEEIIPDEVLLELFKTSKDKVSYKIKRTFQNYYSEILSQNYYEAAECNYDCFLTWRGIGNYTDNVSYYVKGGKLIAFKPFTAYSIFGEENYFKDKHFEFEIATAME